MKRKNLSICSFNFYAQIASWVKSASDDEINRSQSFLRHPYHWPGTTMVYLATMALLVIWPL